MIYINKFPFTRSLYCNFVDCTHVTCQNGGICKSNLQDYHCYCAVGYTGTHCEHCKYYIHLFIAWVHCLNGWKHLYFHFVFEHMHIFCKYQIRTNLVQSYSKRSIMLLQNIRVFDLYEVNSYRQQWQYIENQG